LNVGAQRLAVKVFTLDPRRNADSNEPTMKVTIRPFEDHDIPSMASIRAQEWETEAFWQERISWYLRKEHSPRQALSARVAFVALQEGEVVGFVAGHRTRRYGCKGELQWITVVKAKRGCGVAGELLSKISAWFVEQKAFHICVDVDPKNAAARNLYAKLPGHSTNTGWFGKTSLQ
jgi:GNAT superfamily N-acetyltransferase